MERPPDFAPNALATKSPERALYPLASGRGEPINRRTTMPENDSDKITYKRQEADKTTPRPGQISFEK